MPFHRHPQGLALRVTAGNRYGLATPGRRVRLPRSPEHLPRARHTTSACRSALARRSRCGAAGCLDCWLGLARVGSVCWRGGAVSVSRSASARAALAIGALGVVFGDIGTSPLYTEQTVFNPGDPHPVKVSVENVFGVVSLIFWSVTIIV